MAKPKKALRDYRKKHDLSAAEAAEKVGIAESTWRSYENGNREIDAEVAVHFEKAIKIPREDIRPDLFERPAKATA